MPAPQRDDGADVRVSTQVNISQLSDREAAVRVAFALAKATYELRDETVEVAPREDYPAPREQAMDTMPAPPPPVEDDPAKQRWIEELPLTDEQRRDAAIVRQTHGGSIESYPGSSAEQGGSVQRPTTTSKPTAGELCRRLSRRGELL
ncbi:hypothetical protein D9M71_749270 [compost metagenome]